MRISVIAITLAMTTVGTEAAAQRRRRPVPPNAAVVALQRLGAPERLPATDYRRLMLRQVVQPQRSVELLRMEIFLLRCALFGSRSSVCHDPGPWPI